MFRSVAERDPPGRRVRELYCIIGRRGGKDSVASAIATIAAIQDYAAFLRPGERASVLCLAVDRPQARIVARYIGGYFKENPLLAPMVTRWTDDGLELSNGVEIVIATNSYRAVRGRTIACVIMDEAAYWRDETTFANPAAEVYTALLPGMVTIPGAMLIAISTPYRKTGLLYSKWQRHYGQDDDDVIVVKGPSRTFNPLLPEALIEQALARDPEAAAAEWLAEWRADLSDYIDRELVESLVVKGRRVLPPAAGLQYFAFADCAGGSGSDAMTLAVAHREPDGRGVLDCLLDQRPPFSPEVVTAQHAATLRNYNVNRVVGDAWAGAWPRERFAVHHISYRVSEKTKNEIYRDFLPLLNSGKCSLLDHPRFISELVSLERRTHRGGKDVIDHPSGAHDDLVNAAAGALLLATRKPPFDPRANRRESPRHIPIFAV